MGNAISLFDNNALDWNAGYLQTFTSDAAQGIMLGAGGRNKLGLKGGRFRLLVGGQEEAVLETSSVEVIIVGAAPGVGRIYYEGTWVEGEKTHPLCYSKDGIEPGNDVLHPQSVKCANCPQNQKGSKITAEGQKTKACTFFKRMAVVPLMDPEHRIFQLDGKAMTIFGAGEPARNLFTLTEYGNKLKTRGIDPAKLVTKLSFDLNSSVPKLFFSPVRPITEEEAVWVQDLVASDEVKSVITITAITDASDADSEAPPVETAPVETAVAPKPAQAATKPTVTVVKKTVAPAAPAAAAPAATIVKAKPAAPAPVVAEVSTGDDSLDSFLAQLDGEAQGE